MPDLVFVHGYLGGSPKRDRGVRGADWMHTNAIAYHPGLDQIAISVRSFHEIWILDHSTTTEEAASHRGGRSGKGGDLLYRYGNPQAYRAGTAQDQRFFGQHDVRWIPPGSPGARARRPGRPARTARRRPGGPAGSTMRERCPAGERVGLLAVFVLGQAGGKGLASPGALDGGCCAPGRLADVQPAASTTESALAACNNHSSAVSGEMGPSRRSTWKRFSPSMYSITRYGSSPSIPAS